MIFILSLKTNQIWLNRARQLFPKFEGKLIFVEGYDMFNVYYLLRLFISCVFCADWFACRCIYDVGLSENWKSSRGEKPLVLVTITFIKSSKNWKSSVFYQTTPYFSIFCFPFLNQQRKARKSLKIVVLGVLAPLM